MSAGAWPADFGTCDVCGQSITGSHYHCPCGSTDVTGMYGHHSTVCKVDTKDAGKIVHREFHHCGPDGDCGLKEKTP